ncbi:MAG: bifunctional riboflavin kinase/FAD synthetase [Anaerolineales bacterium]|nr:bifunctional riboflavin kinase/FAD synthetase [Anaerolineales bacterium]MCA9927810.1 bifunctional riboflavin kinase/FAD synthetase [Anaerolineales bacterium]
MKLSYTHVNSFVEVQERRPTFLAIGSFDGIHLGHQKLLHSMVKAAKTVDARTAVITFFPHPKRLLLNLQGPYYISTIQQRVETLANQGIDLIITQPFDDSIRLTRAVDFMEQLCQNLDLKQLWGGDFALGYKREGDVPTLRKIGEEKGYTVELVDTLVEWEGDRVSSSRIRRSLVNGEIEEVNGCLGRPYTVRGEVTMGDQRGRTIGFPTANLKVWPEQLLPANGVYATYAHVRGKTYTAATNIGIRPTIENNRLTIEAHLLDFDADLYDQTIELTFISRIRPEQKFSGLDALKAQIQVDIDAIRAKLIP